LIGVGVIQRTALPTWLGWPGIVIGAGLVLGSAEFLGPNEERGWGLAGTAIPLLYIAWSLWLLAMGIALIILILPRRGPLMDGTTTTMST
jgi:hypothetical protein